MKVLIVDDEPLARHRLARMCAEHPDLEVVAEAGSGAAAIDAVQAHRPDVMLLDVELQDMSGFEVLQSLSVGSEPLAIMVTAYPERALEAFETSAIDYLTKPVDARRFDTAINRARRRQSKALVLSTWEEIASEARAALSDNQASAGPSLRQLVGEKTRRLYFIDADSVDFIESDGNYVTIHVDQDRYICRNTLKHLSVALAPLGFVRIQKSLLMNLTQVAFAERLGHGAFAFTLRRGRRLVSTAKYRKSILEQIRHGERTSKTV
ncbi:MAG TPA: LytTR family DNA-binding domain-containing protein [Steroidobacteraceae bacterium]|nr:LytTR family DNA-binding domain-containing protein [Steroidobacteraceae bacterium]